MNNLYEENFLLSSKEYESEKKEIIIMIHGMDSTKETFKSSAEYLKSYYKIYCLDLRGKI
jgi:hypothetical protein